MDGFQLFNISISLRSHDSDRANISCLEIPLAATFELLLECLLNP